MPSMSGVAEPSFLEQEPGVGEIRPQFAPHLATGISPFQCVFGYQPLVFSEAEKEITVLLAHAMV